MSQAELAERTGKAIKTINEIVQGKASITPETALQFERVLGAPARFWNNRERQYREALAQADERQRLQAHVSWLKHTPLKAMCQAGWIRCLDDDVEQLREVLRFFGVAMPDQWQSLWLAPQAAFRRSPTFEADPIAVSAWLRRGEIEAQQLTNRRRRLLGRLARAGVVRDLGALYRGPGRALRAGRDAASAQGGRH
jgi:plasmid maintenance system antidote protein VapI